VILHPNKFDPVIMQTLRLAFLTSRTLIEKGGSEFAMSQDFLKMIDFDSERMAYDFLIESLEGHVSNLKSESHYRHIVEDTSQIQTTSDYNQRNLAQLQLDESFVLKKNIVYLMKARKDVLN
jgi:hypothetical protein